jgi:curved DNA-binding protein CbpA
MRDLYSVLKVAPKASDAEIKSAFRNLAKTCHPDVKPGDREAEEAFQEVKRAYQLLSHPETRKVYDSYLANRRAVERQRRRSAAATMSATFLLTAATVLLGALWLQRSGLPVGPVIAGALERTGAVDIARTPVRADGARDGADAATVER